MKRIYLDYNSTSPMLPGVLEAMQSCTGGLFGNPSSPHQEGRNARQIIESSRAIVAAWLGVRRDQVIFTSGGTEAINAAVKGTALALRDRGRHIITTAVEHSATLEACRSLADDEGFTVTFLPVDARGLVSPEDLGKAIREDTVLVSIIHVQNEAGTIEPVEELVRVAHEKGVAVHLDGVQAAGKMFLNLAALGADLYSVASHKIGGPKGMGALVLRDGMKIRPLIHGGHHERDLRAGTENVAGIAGFAAAAKIVREKLPVEAARLCALKKVLWESLTERVHGCQQNGDPERSICNTLNVSFDGVDGLSLALNLDLEGISVSTGSACLTGGIQGSPVLRAMGLSPERTGGAIRFSLGWGTTREEILEAVEAAGRIVERLRNTVRDPISRLST